MRPTTTGLCTEQDPIFFSRMIDSYRRISNELMKFKNRLQAQVTQTEIFLRLAEIHYRNRLQTPLCCNLLSPKDDCVSGQILM